MKLLEDMSLVTRLNELDNDKQRKLVLDYAKSEGLEVVFGILKKTMKDKKNFKIITCKGIVLQRMEYMALLGKDIFWSVIINDVRINGTFGETIYRFNKAVKD